VNDTWRQTQYGLAGYQRVAIQFFQLEKALAQCIARSVDGHIWPQQFSNPGT
jgi:hypothetical protein